MNKDLFVTGTDTCVGKTVLSAVLVAALNRKYWKPIQTGAYEGMDRETIMMWTHLPEERIHPEAFVFAAPLSPHLAAAQEGQKIDLQLIRRPPDPEPIIIEGAGGVFVPVNDDAFMLDLMKQLQAPIVVATRTTLGTINHTLLTVSAIRGAGLDLRGVVMVGNENADNRRSVERYGNVAVIGSIPLLDLIDHATLCGVFERHFDKTAFL